MKAYNCYGQKCNGCHQFAEWCLCSIDNNGNLIKAVSNGFEHQAHVDQVNDQLQQEKEQL